MVWGEVGMGPISECITAFCCETNALMFEISCRIRGAFGRRAEKWLMNKTAKRVHLCTTEQIKPPIFSINYPQ